MEQLPGNVAGTQYKKGTKVGSIKRALISNLECYNAANDFGSSTWIGWSHVTLTSVDHKTL